VVFGRGKGSGALPSIELSPELILSIAVSSVELTAKNIAAADRWGIGTASSWSADLAAGTLTFVFPDRGITAPVQFLGSYAPDSRTWLWGWANEAMPAHVTTAASTARDYGIQHRISALTNPKMVLPEPSLADDLASLPVELADLAGLYHGPGSNGAIAFLGYSEFPD
jgi:hypothetical protein